MATAAAPVVDTAPVEGRVAGLAAAVDAVVGVPVDELDEAGLRAELQGVETQVRRLKARQTRLVGAMTARRAQVASAGGQVDDARARQRAAQQVRNELVAQGWTPSEAKQTAQLADQLSGTAGTDDAGGTGAAGAAFDAGQLPPRNATLLADTLAALPADERDLATRWLLDAARRQDPVVFGRTCRRLVAQLDHDAAMAAEDRRYARRRAAVTLTGDGMTVLSGQWSGLDGELVATAIHAFRIPDAPGEHRTPEQATADALVEALRVALRHGDAPANHGIRPHVMVTIPHDTIQTDAGCAEAAWTGPIPYGEARRLLHDAGIARILVDARNLPLEASAEVRNVPTGLYRFLLVRDGGCIAEGCTAPAAWCDVMHLHIPDRAKGRLTPDNAALGCRRHHRLLDRHTWQPTWTDGRPTLRPPRPTPAGP